MYDAVFDNSHATSTYAVELFTPESVRIIRRDRGGGTAVLTGRIAPPGDSIVDGRITWTSGATGTFPFTMTWGRAIAAAARPVLGATGGVASGSLPGSSTPPPVLAGQSDTASGNPNSVPHSSQRIPAASAAAAPEVTNPEEPVSVDLNGTWERHGAAAKGSAGHGERVLLVQLGRDIEGISLDGNDAVGAGEPYLTATIRANKEFGAAIAQRNAQGVAQFADTTIHVDGSDQFRVGDTLIFTRVEAAAVREKPCDTANPARTSAAEALARGIIYVDRKTPELGTCWFYISALQGNRTAREQYAGALIFGTGIPMNLEQGFFWSQALAMEGSYVGAMELAEFFRRGQTVPASQQRARFWRARAAHLNPHVAHDASNPRPSWATDTSPPCEASNPSQANANVALAYGRVAYQARAMTRAACWFQISSDEGHARSTVYLGILYAFGLGVNLDPEKGFALMKTASRAGDLFGEIYGANFAKYGIGTEPNPDLASDLMRDVVRAKDGFDVAAQVQGWGMTFGEAAGAVSSAFQASSTCTIGSGTPTQSDVDQYHACLAAQSRAEQKLAGNLFHRPHYTVEHPEEIFPEFLHW
jgi:TPR repeat protein